MKFNYFYEDSVYDTNSDYKNFAEYDFYDKNYKQLEGREYPAPQKYQPSNELIKSEPADSINN